MLGVFGEGRIRDSPQNFPTPNKEKTLHYRGLPFMYLFIYFGFLTQYFSVQP